jgi:hypothetical protein
LSVYSEQRHQHCQSLVASEKKRVYCDMSLASEEIALRFGIGNIAAVEESGHVRSVVVDDFAVFQDAADSVPKMCVAMGEIAAYLLLMLVPVQC